MIRQAIDMTSESYVIPDPTVGKMFRDDGLCRVGAESPEPAGRDGRCLGTSPSNHIFALESFLVLWGCIFHRPILMCEIKKLCTCSEVPAGGDYWRLEFHYGAWPSWSHLVETRPEHRELAEEAQSKSAGMKGPMPMPLFKELHIGVAEQTHMLKVVQAEEDWLNEANQFDFDYEPFEGDRLMFYIGGENIPFSYEEGRWTHCPHLAHIRDHRSGVDGKKMDEIARRKAARHLKRLKSGSDSELGWGTWLSRWFTRFKESK